MDPPSNNPKSDEALDFLMGDGPLPEEQPHPSPPNYPPPNVADMETELSSRPQYRDNDDEYSDEESPSNNNNNNNNSFYNTNEHSIPNVEEMRTQGAIYHGGSVSSRVSDYYSNVHSGKKRRLGMAIVSVVIGLALIVGMTVGFIGNGSSNNSNNNVVSAASENAESSSGSKTVFGQHHTDTTVNTVVDEPPTDHDGPDREQDVDKAKDPVLEISRLQTIQNFLKVKISHPTDLETDGSPQNLAAQWMASHDTYGDIPTDPSDYTTSFAFVQRYILALLFYALDGPNWNNDSFFLDTQLSVCNWNFILKANQIPPGAETDEFTYGVQCNEEEEVTQLFMTANNMTGSLPAEVGDLLALQRLSLFDNKITGELPRRMERLEDMQFLSIESNELSGNLPDWLNSLTNLEYLALGDNLYTGQLPATLAQLTKLQEVALDHNQLEGSIDVFNEAPNLKVLFLNKNNFTGRIHDVSFTDCPRLMEIDISNNQLTGYLPRHFYEMKIVDVHNNMLKHSLQNVDSDALPLEYLSAAGNRIGGEIPQSFGLFKKLKHLDLSDNQFTGQITDIYDNMPNLEFLFLSNNPFDAGRIPYLRDAIRLQQVSLSGTNRTEVIPSFLGELPELVLLDLSNNALEGSIPPELGNLEKMKYFMLNRNKLSGEIPTELSAMTQAFMIMLDHNDLQGSGPEAICALEPEALAFFVVDCGVVTCECCSSCCEAGDDTCNNSSKLVKYKDGYARDQKVFSDNLIFREAKTQP